MGMCVLVIGQSGSGKSTSLRNFSPDEVGVLNVAGKPLPFRNNLQAANNVKYSDIEKALSRAAKPSYVIDDASYLLTFDSFNSATETGYAKYTRYAVNFYNLLRVAATKTPDDCIVYFLMHEDTDSNTGQVKAKTVGKMIESQLTLEGLFTIVLRTRVAEVDGTYSYQFETQSNGLTPCKSPIGMLPPVMENDLRAVDAAIREYYGWAKEGESKNGKDGMAREN